MQSSGELAKKTLPTRSIAYNGPRGPMKMAKSHQATQNVYIAKTVKKNDTVAYEIIDTYPNVEDPGKGCNLD